MSIIYELQFDDVDQLNSIDFYSVQLNDREIYYL